MTKGAKDRVDVANAPAAPSPRCPRCAELERRLTALDAEIRTLQDAAAAPPPLRHRVVDAANRALHRMPGVHGPLKRAALLASRFLPERSHATDAIGSAARVQQEPAVPSPAAPTPQSGVRDELAERFLSGNGFEVGALENPLRVPSGANVRFIDRLTLEQARVEYPELGGWPLVKPQIIAEADRLAPIASGSADFMIANHVLEHLRDPISALREWLRVLRPGGHLYVAVPDHDNPFDRTRAVSTFEHLVADEASPAGRAREADDHAHYVDWARALQPQAALEEAEARAAELEARRYAIHFHVFDRQLFERVLAYASAGAGGVVELRTNPGEPEHIAIVQRRA